MCGDIFFLKVVKHRKPEAKKPNTTNGNRHEQAVPIHPLLWFQ